MTRPEVLHVLLFNPWDLKCLGLNGKGCLRAPTHISSKKIKYLHHSTTVGGTYEDLWLSCKPGMMNPGNDQAHFVSAKASNDMSRDPL